MNAVGWRGSPSPKAMVLGALLVGAMMFSFQNCGVGFQPAGTEDGSQVLSSLKMFAVTSGSSGYLAGMVSIGKGAIFRMTVDPVRIPDGARLLWDNVYADGRSYCEQTTSIDQMTADFQCPNDGIVTVSLSLYLEGSEIAETEKLTVVVGLPSSIGLVSGGGSSGSGGVTPTPTPVVEDPGAKLYLNNCRDCHGDLAKSAKRGATRARLDSAIAGVPAMRNLSVLNSAERDLIIQALQ